MILPIYAYGQPVLKKVAKDITPDYEGLAELIANMWETMENANGVGLAAPHKGFKKVFINAEILEETGEDISYSEGCLSIPDISGDVERPETITMKWVDENFEPHEATFTDMNARVHRGHPVYRTLKAVEETYGEAQAREDQERRD